MKTWHLTSATLPSTFKIQQIGFNTYANGMTVREGGGSGFTTNSSISLQVDEANIEKVEDAYKAEGIPFTKAKSLFYSA